MPINRVQQGSKQCEIICDSREKRQRLVLGFAKVLYTLLLIEEAMISLPREITTGRRQKFCRTSISLVCFLVFSIWLSFSLLRIHQRARSRESQNFNKKIISGFPSISQDIVPSWL